MAYITDNITKKMIVPIISSKVSFNKKEIIIPTESKGTSNPPGIINPPEFIFGE